MTDTAPDSRARAALAGSRFADVRWVDSTGSTNADVLALARDGEREGVVVVADHQTAGRGRLGRTWTAPPGAALLLTVLLRPPAPLAGATTMATAVAAAEAVEQLTGRSPRLKWPNDLVWPGDGTGPDRKLAGILAEVDWPPGATAAGGWSPGGPTDRVAVAVGIGLNVRWPEGVPADLAELAVTVAELAAQEPVEGVLSASVDRVDLLVAFLLALDRGYARLLADGGRDATVAAWRIRSATLGRRVRVDLGARDVEGVAVEVTTDGHLVVDGDDGERRTFAVGDVVHLRPVDR
ncbi:MAG: birA, biotin-(acetyl-CoA-carboxylase) ligase [Acidimicrobiales bacterium]|nr:birA, biotin-(acetyl-CoA-carboxylase) ligase [Acidimicrobiales bacterium]